MALSRRNVLGLSAGRPALLTALTTPHPQQLRWTTTKPIPLRIRTPAEGQAILAQQRLRRPVSPHLSIYKFQVHSVSSAMERNTGILLSGGLYIFATSYLLTPYLGWDLSSASIVAAVAGLSVGSKIAIKLALAWPFTFHVINGVRYVVTALGGQTLRDRELVIKIAWGVVGGSFVTALGLVAYF